MEFEKHFWNKRYERGGNSGDGSYGEQLEKKLNWITPLDFTSISEFGCGDFNFGKSILERHPADYIGYDVSNFIVEKNQQEYPNQKFKLLEDEIVPAELVMCIDVLFHVIYPDEVEKILTTLEKAWTKYLVITAYERDEEKFNHVRIRNFDYKRFGELIVREIVEEEGQLYFYIFKK